MAALLGNHAVVTRIRSHKPKAEILPLRVLKVRGELDFEGDVGGVHTGDDERVIRLSRNGEVVGGRRSGPEAREHAIDLLLAQHKRSDDQCLCHGRGRRVVAVAGLAGGDQGGAVADNRRDAVNDLHNTRIARCVTDRQPRRGRGSKRERDVTHPSLGQWGKRDGLSRLADREWPGHARCRQVLAVARLGCDDVGAAGADGLFVANHQY